MSPAWTASQCIASAAILIGLGVVIVWDAWDTKRAERARSKADLLTSEHSHSEEIFTDEGIKHDAE